jgi:hypothetical protein
VDGSYEHAACLRLQADKTKIWSKKALKKRLVLTTWSGVLKNEHNLLSDWLSNGFLVGMGPLS